MCITLRELVSDDARVLAGWQTDPRFAAQAGWRLTSEISDGEGWWRESIRTPDPLLIRLGAVEAETLVGYVDLHGDKVDERELGYLIGPSSRWGRGLATAAAKAAISYGFDQLGLRRVWAEAVAANPASVRVLEKVGLRAIGRGEAETFLGQESHYEQFEILRADWHARS
ncbi:MAG: GNAT family N-acetyltransferase [Cryobacterium sp.]|nr:GNAT family N-acetyltransferase [Cryobacterium sp.]